MRPEADTLASPNCQDQRTKRPAGRMLVVQPVGVHQFGYAVAGVRPGLPAETVRLRSWSPCGYWCVSRGSSSGNTRRHRNRSSRTQRCAKLRSSASHKDATPRGGVRETRARLGFGFLGGTGAHVVSRTRFLNRRSRTPRRWASTPSWPLRSSCSGERAGPRSRPLRSAGSGAYRRRCCPWSV